MKMTGREALLIQRGEETIRITGVMVHTVGGEGESRSINVCVEVDGQWVTIFTEPLPIDDIISHIVEPLGIAACAERQR